MNLRNAECNDKDSYLTYFTWAVVNSLIWHFKDAGFDSINSLKILKLIGVLQYNDGAGAVVGLDYALCDIDRLRGPLCLPFGSYRGIFPWR